MSRTRYSPPQPKSVTIVGVMLIMLGTAGIIFYKKDSLHPFKTPHQTTFQSSTPVEYEAQTSALPKKAACKVLTVYDGDTLACDLNQNNRIDKPEEEIRLLGIDTPEMHYSKKNRSHHTANEQDEPFAKEASALLTEKAAKQVAYLTFDQEHYDKYGRTLAYVSLSQNDEAGLCKLMLKHGYAKTLFIPPNFKYFKDFKAIEKQARNRFIGLWSEK